MDSNSFKKGVDFVGIAVVFFCHDGKGQFVMAKRSQNARDEQGRWDNGAGALEMGDSVENTLRKEVKEEYGTDVIDFEFLGYRDTFREHNGKPTHWLDLDFKVLVDPAKVKNNEPHKFDEVKWFSLDGLPENLHSQIPNFLEKYKGKLI